MAGHGTWKISLLALGGLLGLAGSPVMAQDSAAVDRGRGRIDPAALRSLAEGGGRAKVWVFFTDKAIASDQAYAAAIADVTARYDTHAVARRQMRRTLPGLFDVYDLDVAPAYVDAVLATGARLGVVSRWLNAISVHADAAQLARIAALPFVQELRPVARGRRVPVDPGGASGTPAGPVRAGFYGLAEEQLAQIHVTELHAEGFTGTGVRVGVLDTGFRRSHAAFTEPNHPLRVIAEWDFVKNDGNTAPEPNDLPNQHEHGTLILGVLGAYKPDELVGGAYNASFILAKAEDVASEYPLEEDWFAAGLEFIEQNGGDVASSSLVAYWYTQDQMDGKTSLMARAFHIATLNGVHGCQGVGNSGHDQDPNTAHLVTPGDAFGVISCGAVDAAGAIAIFSSDGPTQDGRVKPEVLARGVDTWTVSPYSDTTYEPASGTSLATPVLASAVACLVQKHPDWTVEQVRAALFATADYYRTNKTYDPFYVLGYGLVDIAAAGRRVLGDLNCDRAVNLADITPFVLALSDPDEYRRQFPDCELLLADCSGDGQVNFADINPFVERLGR